MEQGKSVRRKEWQRGAVIGWPESPILNLPCISLGVGAGDIGIGNEGVKLSLGKESGRKVF